MPEADKCHLKSAGLSQLHSVVLVGHALADEGPKPSPFKPNASQIGWSCPPIIQFVLSALVINSCRRMNDRDILRKNQESFRYGRSRRHSRLRNYRANVLMFLNLFERELGQIGARYLESPVWAGGIAHSAALHTPIVGQPRRPHNGPIESALTDEAFAPDRVFHSGTKE